MIAAPFVGLSGSTVSGASGTLGVTRLLSLTGSAASILQGSMVVGAVTEIRFTYEARVEQIVFTASGESNTFSAPIENSSFRTH
jgi:hypothetical protein